MKTIIKSALILAIAIGIVCVTGECEDMTSQLTWTLSWMGEMALCSWLLVKLNPELKEEDFLDDESYKEALESWEWAESDYAEDSREWMRERDE